MQQQQPTSSECPPLARQIASVVDLNSSMSERAIQSAMDREVLRRELRPPLPSWPAPSTRPLPADEKARESDDDASCNSMWGGIEGFTAQTSANVGSWFGDLLGGGNGGGASAESAVWDAMGADVGNGAGASGSGSPGSGSGGRVGAAALGAHRYRRETDEDDEATKEMRSDAAKYAGVLGTDDETETDTEHSSASRKSLPSATKATKATNDTNADAIPDRHGRDVGTRRRPLARKRRAQWWRRATAIVPCAINSIGGVAYDVAHWTSLPGNSGAERIRYALLRDSRPVHLCGFVLTLILFIVIVAMFFTRI